MSEVGRQIRILCRGVKGERGKSAIDRMRKGTAWRTGLWLGASIVAMAGAAPALGAVIDYPNGSTDSSPIVLTDNTTQLQVTTGTATQSGAISQSGGSFGLEKIGAGTLITTATNTYSGITTITTGTLQIGNGGSSGSLGSGNVVDNGALVFNLAGGPVSVTQSISGSGSVTFHNTTQYQLTGTNTYSGGTIISEGAILVGTGGTSGSIIGNVVSGVTTANAGINFDRSDDITFSGNISGLGYVAQYGTGTLTLTGNNTYGAYTTLLNGTVAVSGDTNLGSGPVKFDGGNLRFLASTTSALNYELTSGAIDTNGNSVTLSGVVSTYTGANVAGGYGGLTKIGAGTLTLTGANTYAGPTLISAGTLQIGNGGASGVLGTGNVTDNGTLTFDRSDTVTLTQVITGNGGLTQAGSGTLTLLGTDSYTGSTTISAGTLQLGNHTSNGSIAGNVIDNALLVLAPATETVYAGTISGTGAVQIPAANTFPNGPVFLTGNNSYTGGTTISSGSSLYLGNGGASGSIVGDVVDSGSLIFARTDTVTFAGNISGSGILEIVAPGTVIFTGAVTNGTLITAVTVLSGATLQIGNGGTTGSITSNITGGNVIFDRSDTYSYGRQIFGSSVDVKAGTLTLTNLDYPASMRVESGATLIFGYNFGNSGSLIILNPGSSVGFGGSSPVSVDGQYSLQGSGVVFETGNTTGTLMGPISGTGDLRVTGGGTLVLQRAFPPSPSTYSGGTEIVGGSTLEIDDDSDLGAVNSLLVLGDSTGSGTIKFSSAFNLNVARGISVGSSGGTFDTSGVSTTVSQSISGTGGLTKAGAGTLTLTSANTYTGGTTVTGGTLQLGSGGSFANVGALSVNGGTFDLNSQTQTVGALSGTGGAILLGAGSLTTNSASNTTLASIVSGSGSLTKAGTGTLNLVSTNTYTGGTTVSAGTLNVTGSIASSAVSVANGATLTGTGTVGAVTVASGGTLSPGAGGVPGTLTVQGNLALASGANYVDALTPTVTGLTSVTGSAAVNGALTVNAAAGAYTLGQRYTLLSAAGGLSGTFSSVGTTGLNAYRAAIGYDADSVFLTLSAKALTPLLPAGVGGNSVSAAKAIDTAVAGGATLNSGFNTLFGLPSAALGSAMSQISGETGADAAQGGSQAFLPFVSTLMAEGVGGSATVTAANFAPASAYGEDGAPKPAQLDVGATRVWGSVYGRHTGIAADPSAGTQSLKAGDAGFAAGIEMQVSDDLRLGAAAGGGHGSFNAGNGLGASNDAMLGLYGNLAVADGGYVAGAFSYGWHDIDTLRLLTVSGTDLLSAKYTAHDVGARIEGGWRVALDEQDGLVPYAAFVWDDFQAPAYGESAASGSANFALSYAAHDSDFGHSELGLKAGRSIATGGGVMALELSAAWAHELYGAPFALANFQALPGSSFVVQGARIAQDTALLGAGLDWNQGSGLALGARIDSQLGGGTTVLAGTGTISLRF